MYSGEDSGDDSGDDSGGEIDYPSSHSSSDGEENSNDNCYTPPRDDEILLQMAGPEETTNASGNKKRSLNSDKPDNNPNKKKKLIWDVNDVAHYEALEASITGLPWMWEHHGYIGYSPAHLVTFGTNDMFFTAAKKQIKIWNAATRVPNYNITTSEKVRAIAVSRVAQLYYVGDSNDIVVWDLEKKRISSTLHGRASEVHCVTLHDEKTLVTGDSDSICRAWDIRSEREVFTLSGHGKTISSVFSKDYHIVTGSLDSTIKFWDSRTDYKEILSLQNNTPVRGLTPSINTFSAMFDLDIKRYNLSGDMMPKLISTRNTTFTAMAVYEDVLAIGCDNGNLWFCDQLTGKCVQQILDRPGYPDRRDEVRAMSFDISGNNLVTCEARPSIHWWRKAW